MTAFIIRYRILILVAAGLVTVGFASALHRLETDDDLLKFLPKDHPDVRLFQKVNARFGGLDVAIVGLEADTMFNSNRLIAIRKLTRGLAEIEGVYDVMSFTEAPDPRPSPFGLVVEPLVDRVPKSKAELSALKERVLQNETAVGNLISKDGRAAMILCFLGGDRPPIHTAADIQRKAREIWNDGKMYFGGAPFIRLHLAGGTQTDLRKLTPVVALVVTLITLLIFRRPMGVLLALGVVGSALIWLMGLLSWMGHGLTVVDTSLPTLLVAVGGAYGIHILSAYFNGQATDVPSRVVEALKSAGPPVIASTLTTCAGFLSFLVMDVTPLNHFGVFASMGIAFTAILALTIIPAVLSFGKRVPTQRAAGFLSVPMGRIGRWSAENRLIVLLIASSLGLLSLTGIARIAPDATLKTFFRPGSEPDRAVGFLKKHFGGSVYLQVYFEGDMRSPFVLAHLRSIVEFTQGLPEVVQVSSIIDPLVMMSEAMGGHADLPINRERTRSLYPFLDGASAIDQIVSPEKDAGLVQIRLRTMAPDDVAGMVAKLRRFIANEVPPGISTHAMTDLSAKEQREIKQDRAIQIAKRIARLAGIYADGFESGRLKALASAIASGWTEPMPTAPDMEREIRKLVEEHILGDASLLEAPEPDVGAGVQDEWNRRGDLAVTALLTLATDFADESTVRQSLRTTLPHSTSRDMAGMNLVAESVAFELMAARNRVRSNRLAPQLLAEIGVAAPNGTLLSKTSLALTEMGTPTVVAPVTSGESKHPIRASVTGQPIVNTVLCESTIRNQFKSLIVALMVLLTVLSVTFRSIRTAFKALAPPLFTLAAAVGIMGALRIPLDLTTSMVAAIALGIGVDYAIHFLWRRRTRGEDLYQTTAKVGPSIGANAVQVAAGFAVLTVSDMVPMQRFGALVAMAMILCAIGTFALLPALRAEGNPPKKD